MLCIICNGIFFCAVQGKGVGEEGNGKSQIEGRKLKNIILVQEFRLSLSLALSLSLSLSCTVTHLSLSGAGTW